MPTAAPSSGVWRFWRKPARSLGRPFTVRCVCGGVAAGRRQPDDQAVACPQCAAPMFVLGEGAWPAVEELPCVAGPAEAAKASPPRRIFGVNASLVAVLLCLAAALLWRHRPQPPPADENGEAAAAWHAAAKSAGEHDWSRAAREAEAAARTRNAEVRSAALALRDELEPLLNLSSCSLAELVREAARTSFKEWPAVWRLRHQDRTVAWALHGQADFDLLANAHPEFVIDWGLTAAERDSLEEDADHRCFTLRLLSCKLEEQPGGGSRWVVRFQPGSLRRLSPKRVALHHELGVAGLLAAAAAQQVPDERLREQLKRVSPPTPAFAWQQAWHGGAAETWRFGPPNEALATFFPQPGEGPLRLLDQPIVQKPAWLQKK